MIAYLVVTSSGVAGAMVLAIAGRRCAGSGRRVARRRTELRLLPIPADQRARPGRDPERLRDEELREHRSDRDAPVIR